MLHQPHGVWEDYLLIKIQIIDSAVGNLYIGLSFKDSYLTVMMRKTVEDLFNEYVVFSAEEQCKLIKAGAHFLSVSARS